MSYALCCFSFFQHGAPRLAYFTDLAEMVAKIEEPSTSTSFYEPDADDEGTIFHLINIQ